MYFELHVRLDKFAYMLRDWKAKLYLHSCLHTIMEQISESLLMSEVDHCGYFPEFIQNIHYHFVEIVATRYLVLFKIFNFDN